MYPLVLEIEEGRIPDLELFGPFLLLKPLEDERLMVQELIQTKYGFLVSFFGSADGAKIRSRWLNAYVDSGTLSTGVNSQKF